MNNSSYYPNPLPSPTFTTPLSARRRNQWHTKKHHYSQKPSIISPTSLLQIAIPKTSLVTVQSFPTPQGSTFTLMTAVITPLPSLPPTDPLPPTPRHSSDSDSSGRKRVLARINDLNRPESLRLQERRKLRRVGKIPRPLSISRPRSFIKTNDGFLGVPTPPGSGSPMSSVFNTVVRSPIGVRWGAEDEYWSDEDEGAEVDELIYGGKEEKVEADEIVDDWLDENERVEVEELIDTGDEAEEEEETVEADEIIANGNEEEEEEEKVEADDLIHNEEEKEEKLEADELIHSDSKEEEEEHEEEEEEFFTPAEEFSSQAMEAAFDRIQAQHTGFPFPGLVSLAGHPVHSRVRSPLGSPKTEPEITASADLADGPVEAESPRSTPPRTPPALPESPTITIIHNPPPLPLLPSLALIPPTPLELASNPLSTSVTAITTIAELDPDTEDPIAVTQETTEATSTPQRPPLPKEPSLRESKLHPFWAPRRPGYLSPGSRRGVRRSVVFEDMDGVREAFADGSPAEGAGRVVKTRKRYRVEFVGLGGCWRVFIGGGGNRAKSPSGSPRRRLSRVDSRTGRGGKRNSVNF